MTAMEHLVAHLKMHEGFRDLVYDDATGKPIGPGTTVLGNPTIGYGWALNKRPMVRSVAETLLRDTVQEVIFDLQHALPWVKDLDEVRSTALYELAYQNGVGGLLKYDQTLDLLRRRRYAEAATELLDSQAARAMPGRYHILSDMIRTGQWPGEVT